MAKGIENIEHVVVVMMENRSFDNLLGWLYSPTDPPAGNIPEQTPPTFDGLLPGKYFNQAGGSSSPKVSASRPPTTWPSNPNSNCVPTPDPHEEFVHITNQIFGTETPAPGAVADMSGFLKDYASTAAGTASAAQIMETYGPAEANVIKGLARNFAVCDAWFASCPCQTWPNRGFVHTGSSDGHINNDNYELYDIQTIFNVLEARKIAWGVFADRTLIPSLTWGQFLPRVAPYSGNFHRFDSFAGLCRAKADANVSSKLPAYSFIEPRFVAEVGLFKIDYPSDYHPPHNVCRGETFLASVYEAVRTSPYRDKILLIITCDEHGGCYDHVPPPTGAVSPIPGGVSRDGSFHFDRFGVRVPAVVVSSYVRPGTVFRAAPGKTPYDHTSILATLRDWLVPGNDPAHPFLPSPRIAAAPTLQSVLTLDDQSKNTNWPTITAQCQISGDDESLDTPLNDVQKSLVASAMRDETSTPIDQAQTAGVAKQLETYEHALNFMHPDAP
jgi:phospholipase C